MLKFINKLLGALYYLSLCAVWIPLVVSMFVLSIVYGSLKELYRFNIAVGLFGLLIVSPLMVFSVLPIIMNALGYGWKFGLKSLLSSALTRVKHFFKRQLFFGLRDEDSMKIISTLEGFGFWADMPNFLGRITSKFMSLILPMETYLSYDAGLARAKNGVNVHYTKENIRKLMGKYNSPVLDELGIKVILQDIYNYFHWEERTATFALEKAKKALEKAEEALSNETQSAKDLLDHSAGEVQSAKDRLDQVRASIRCVSRFKNEPDEGIPGLACSSVLALCLVWRAIETQGKDDPSKRALKHKLSVVLYQIQRGVNLTSGSTGADLPEGPYTALGLLARVLSHESETTEEKEAVKLLPDSDYQVQAPSKDNLILVLRETLNAPFKSSDAIIRKKIRDEYIKNRNQYKANKAEQIQELWAYEYRELFTSTRSREALLSKTELDNLINTEITAWQPPEPRPAPSR